MKNIAVILAGGKGNRFGDPLPKQFLKVAGKMIIEHTIEVFQNHIEIDEIAIVSNADYVIDVERICAKNMYSKVKKILKGGSERYHSSLAAINAYSAVEDCNLIFHDAVRPLVNNRIISDCISALSICNAVDVAVKTTDTIIRVSSEMTISGIPIRKELYNGQTPQAFKLKTIKKAYELALKDKNFETTDDCGVVYKYLPNEDVRIVEGEGSNMKLTYKEDLFLIDKLFQLRTMGSDNKNLLPNIDEDIKSKVIVIFGGSYGIGKDIVNICKEKGGKVHSFSRSENNVDVSDQSMIKSVLESVYKKEGRIDYVINTAGVLQKEPLCNMDYSDIISGVNINYIGSIIVAKEAAKYLKESKGGLLLFTSSSYTRGRAMYSLYSSSKAAIVNLVQALSDEWYDWGIKVNCINPERTKTPMRIKNFGIEPDNTLLTSFAVATASINTLVSNMNGVVIDVKRN
ncbi:bifunctional cytidylyltransferase/SDR family oxidoreductase [Ancylomarina sp. 16SWW S1-10-2]|uniref:bifunctional cytidylyltransferase/SDR family oxidoreductase n=1 Tax=Ancylomarina sp. 16SWW S1-10-2 TaxID=2499681 RepID=UPI0012AE1A2E|nr:bifunctional cytidylyltransferase/SDR family oxidoreductase [Ancylomarina sp. 16SWW S1-10-2]MRT94805.1 SDR family NAD(P)-dependent oxidoreductase [Ancylomarina sp. 16SWW S1-10-2]